MVSGRGSDRRRRRHAPPRQQRPRGGHGSVRLRGFQLMRPELVSKIKVDVFPSVNMFLSFFVLETSGLIFNTLLIRIQSICRIWQRSLTRQRKCASIQNKAVLLIVVDIVCEVETERKKQFLPPPPPLRLRFSEFPKRPAPIYCGLIQISLLFENTTSIIRGL